MYICDDDAKEIVDTYKYICQAMNGPPLQLNLQERNGWNNHTFSMIHWTSFSKSLERQQPTQRLKLLKMIHNWQNTGYQREQFGDVAGRLCPYDKRKYLCTISPVQVLVCKHINAME